MQTDSLVFCPKIILGTGEQQEKDAIRTDHLPDFTPISFSSSVLLLLLASLATLNVVMSASPGVS